MSTLDTYRRNVAHKMDELAKFQKNKATENSKLASISSKINTASRALQQTRNASSAASKQREISRYQQEYSTVEKRVADWDLKIARKQKELSDEQRKVAREEEKEQKKRNDELQRQSRSLDYEMNRISSTISRHEALHRDTQLRLEKLQQLPEKIVVLFLAANPQDQPQLRLDEEARSITEMIQKAKHRDAVKFETRWAIRSADVLQAINEVNPTVVHFSGHGTDDDQIVFQNPDGSAKLVSKEAIVQAMRTSSDNIRLVFFNTCYSRNQAEAVTKHIETAIGMNTSIGDEAARVFASQFYSSIGFGNSIQKSFDQAKALVMMEGIEEENTPELFVQDGLDPNDIIIVRPV
ncbi:CHAT domain-containing protein [Ohtaekwangia kribbensis]|uniref:CHAT domain-containing protein n=1 Tax=Ohtaekwangia kribbensis TaxID=688913 RepID=A0ABW3K5E0_9BACT